MASAPQAPEVSVPTIPAIPTASTEAASERSSEKDSTLVSFDPKGEMARKQASHDAQQHLLHPKKSPALGSADGISADAATQGPATPSLFRQVMGVVIAGLLFGFALNKGAVQQPFVIQSVFSFGAMNGGTDFTMLLVRLQNRLRNHHLHSRSHSSLRCFSAQQELQFL